MTAAAAAREAAAAAKAEAGAGEEAETETEEVEAARGSAAGATVGREATVKEGAAEAKVWEVEMAGAVVVMEAAK